MLTYENSREKLNYSERAETRVIHFHINHFQHTYTNTEKVRISSCFLKQKIKRLFWHSVPRKRKIKDYDLYIESFYLLIYSRTLLLFITRCPNNLLISFMCV